MPEPSDPVYFEHSAVGAYRRVAAICGRTGIEVVVMGPLHASQYDLERLASRKLQRRLAQESGEP